LVPTCLSWPKKCKNCKNNRMADLYEKK
jgi:hypothetical protein